MRGLGGAPRVKTYRLYRVLEIIIQCIEPWNIFVHILCVSNFFVLYCIIADSFKALNVVTAGMCVYVLSVV